MNFSRARRIHISRCARQPYAMRYRLFVLWWEHALSLALGGAEDGCHWLAVGRAGRARARILRGTRASEIDTLRCFACVPQKYRLSGGRIQVYHCRESALIRWRCLIHWLSLSNQFGVHYLWLKQWRQNHFLISSYKSLRKIWNRKTYHNILALDENNMILFLDILNDHSNAKYYSISSRRREDRKLNINSKNSNTLLMCFISCTKKFYW